MNRNNLKEALKQEPLNLIKSINKDLNAAKETAVRNRISTVASSALKA